MGKIGSKLMRPIKTWNVEERAFKVLDKRQQIPDVAPKHATTVEKISKFREENPQIMEEMSTKHESLHDRLKSVYVQSQGQNAEIKTAEKPMPLSRSAKDDLDLGAYDVDYEVPPGKIGLKTMLTVLSERQLNRDSVTAEGIAEEYNLPLEDVKNVLEHFAVMQIYIPPSYQKNKKIKKLMEEQMAAGGLKIRSLQAEKGDGDKKLLTEEEVATSAKKS